MLPFACLVCAYLVWDDNLSDAYRKETPALLKFSFQKPEPWQIQHKTQKAKRNGK